MTKIMRRKISVILTMLLVIQLIISTTNAAYAATNSNILPPSNLTYQLLTPDDVKLSWSTVYGATGYKVYTITEGSLVNLGTVTAATYTLNNLAEGSYRYVVSTISPEGESGPSAPITVVIDYPEMVPPSSLTYTIQDGNDIVLSWGSVANAQTYKLYQLASDGQKTQLYNGTARTFTVPNVPEGNYTYAVLASNTTFGESALSTPLQVALGFPIMTAPSSLTQSVSNYNDITLTWTAVPNATNYKVYQVVDGAAVLKSTVAGTTVKFTGMEPGSYTYEVRSYSDRFGESKEGKQVTATIGDILMVPPANAAYAIRNGNDIALTWTAASNANSYNVYQIVNGQKELKTKVTTTSATFTNLPAGDYSYVIHSFSTRFGESEAGSTISVKLEPVVMAAPENLAYTIQNGNDLVLSWKAATYANSYKVYQIVNGEPELKSTATGTTVTFAKHPAGDYIYEVRSVSTRFGESQEGSRVTPAIAEVDIPAPANLAYTIRNGNDIVLTWDAAANANSYKVFQIVDGQPVLKSTVTSQTVSFTNMPVGDYKYEVRSVSTRYGESAEASAIAFTLNAVVMAAPGNLAYKIQNGNDLVLNWDTVPYAGSYEVYQVIDGQPVLKSTVTTATVTFTNMPAGDYKYEVRSVSARFGKSPQAAALNITVNPVVMEAPGNLAYKIQNQTDLVLTWDPVVFANSYKVYQVIDGQRVLKGTVTGTTTTYAKLTGGEYKFEVHSVSTRFGESPEGSTVTVTLQAQTMVPPATLTYTISNVNTVTLNWTAVPYANNYNVYELVDGQKVLKSTISALSVAFSNLPENNYTYVVHSVSSVYGESAEGTEIKIPVVYPVIEAPGSFAYKIQNGNDVVLSWASVGYANSYKIYEWIDGNKVLIKTVTTLNTVLSNVSSGEHTYIIHAVSNRFGESPEGSKLTFTMVFPAMTAPSNATYTIANGNDLTLKWNAVQYANSYNVYLVTGEEKVLKSTVATTSAAYLKVPAGDYRYVVHSISTRFGESPEGSEIHVAIDHQDMQAPGNLTYTITAGNNINLKWDTVPYSTQYKIYQIVDGQKVLLRSITGTTTSFTNMTAGEYTYVVHSFSDRFGESEEGSQAAFTLVHPIMQAPETLTHTISSNVNIVLNWTASTYATGYKVYQMVNGQKTLKSTITGLTTTYANMPAGDYTFIVHSYSDRFGESQEGKAISFKLIYPTMQPPANPTYTIANGNDVTLRWGATTYAASYKIYQIADGQRQLLKTQTGTAYTIANMPEGPWKYEITSVNNTFGESPDAAVIDFEMVWPEVKAPIVKGAVFNANNITLSWPAVTWANEYRVYKVTDGSRQLLNKGTALNYTVYNLAEDTHHFEVTAFSTRFGESEPSNTITEVIVYPTMQPPVATLKLLNNNTSAQIIWDFITYANGYNVYELLDGKRVLIAEKVNNLSYVVNNLPYANHEYVVTSYSNSFGESEPSNVVLAKLIVDTEPPVTKAQVPATWTNQTQVVTLLATDNETGIQSTFYAVNDGAYTEGTSVEVSDDGITRISFYSVDKVGNKEVAQTAEVKIDKTAPVTTADAPTGWMKEAVTVTLTATDAASGVAKTYYALNGGSYVEGTSAVVDQEGVSSISFYSVDAAGNEEKAQTVEVKVDKTAAVTTADAPTGWTKEAVTVALTATDAASGVAKTYYAVNGGSYVEGTLAAVDQEGVSSISFYSVDAAGNEEKAQTVEVKIDKTAPVTTANAPTGWAKEAVTVALTATDAASGVAKTYYAVNGGAYVEGTSAVVDQEGVSSISFYSVDAAGNEEKAQTVEVKIDKTAAVTTADAPTGWTKEAVTVTLTATDAASGVAKTYYAVNGGAYVEGTSAVVDQEGVSSISFYSVDAAGNEEKAQTAEVKIDKTAPIVTLDINGEYALGAAVVLSYKASDSLSGIASETMTVTGPTGESALANNSALKLEKPGVYTVKVTVTNGAGLSSTTQKQLAVFVPATIEVTPKVIKGNKGVFTVRVDLPAGYSTQGFDLKTAKVNGVAALSSNNGYFNQAKQGQFKFERSDFPWKASEVVLEFRGYVDGHLVIGQTTVKVND